jgi:hypothetical protein
MAFSDLDTAATIGLMVRFSGIPYVFADFAQPTAAGWGSASGTVTIDSESYTWSRTLHLPRSITASSKYDPNRHRVQAGGVSFDFLLPGTQDPFTTNPWFSLINIDPFRSDSYYAVLQSTLDADDTTATVTTTTGWPSSGDLYVGTETISYSGTTATTFTGLTRGAYNSQPLQHNAAFVGPLEVASGAYVTAHHTVWRNRIARFWIVRGKTVDGVFVPDATAIEDEATDKLLQYRVTDGKMDGAGKLARVPSNSLESLDDEQFAIRLPTASAGLTDAARLFRVDDAINTLSWSWFTYDETNDTTTNVSRQDVTLQRDTGGGTPGDVTNGFYTLTELAEFIEFTIYYAGFTTPFWFVPATDTANFNLSNAGDNKIQFNAYHALASAVTGTWSFTLVLHASPTTSVLRPCGFQGDNATTEESLLNGQYFSLPTKEGSRPYARLYLPDNREQTTIKTHSARNDLSFTANPGYLDDDDSIVGGFVRIANLECCKISGVAANGELTISARGQLGSRHQEIYIEQGEDPPEVKQGLAFPGVTWPRMLLYLMLGGSGVSGLNDTEYDRGWDGSGLNIDADLVDKASFILAVTKLANTQRDNWAFFEATKLRDVMDVEGLLNNAVIRQKDGLLNLAIITRDLEAEELESLPTLAVADQHDDTNRRTYSSGENMISNALTLQGAWDHGTNEARHTVQAIEGTSVTSYGMRNRRSVEVRGIAGIDALVSGALDLTSNYFAIRAFPRAVFGIPYTRAHAWDHAVMDKASVSDDLLPALSVGGASVPSERGFSNATAQMVSVRTILPAARESRAERARIEFMTTRRDSSRYSYWAPAAYCHTLSGGGTVLECRAHEYSGDESGVPVDVAWFDTDRAGSSARVTIYAFADPSTTITRIVNAVSTGSNTITVNLAVALTPPLAVEYLSYASPLTTDEQRKYTYMSDNDHKLDGSTTDQPYKYG